MLAFVYMYIFYAYCDLLLWIVTMGWSLQSTKNNPTFFIFISHLLHFKAFTSFEIQLSARLTEPVHQILHWNSYVDVDVEKHFYTNDQNKSKYSIWYTCYEKCRHHSKTMMNFVDQWPWQVCNYQFQGAKYLLVGFLSNQSINSIKNEFIFIFDM